MRRALMMLGAVGASALFFVLVWGLLHGLAWGVGATGDGITEFTSGVVATMALALAGLGVWFQVDEVRQQREELRGSREAQERLAASQEKANELAAEAINAQERANDMAERQLAQQATGLMLQLVESRLRLQRVNLPAQRMRALERSLPQHLRTRVNQEDARDEQATMYLKAEQILELAEEELKLSRYANPRAAELWERTVTADILK